MDALDEVVQPPTSAPQHYQPARVVCPDKSKQIFQHFPRQRKQNAPGLFVLLFLVVVLLLVVSLFFHLFF
jgi:predicted nucleic acid-binding Zn ribbon protein